VSVKWAGGKRNQKKRNGKRGGTAARYLEFEDATTWVPRAAKSKRWNTVQKSPKKRYAVNPKGKKIPQKKKPCVEKGKGLKKKRHIPSKSSIRMGRVPVRGVAGSADTSNLGVWGKKTESK